MQIEPGEIVDVLGRKVEAVADKDQRGIYPRTRRNVGAESDIFAGLEDGVLIRGHEFDAGFVVIGAQREKLDGLQKAVRACGFQANSFELVDDVLCGGFEAGCSGETTLELVVG